MRFSLTFLLLLAFGTAAHSQPWTLKIDITI